MLVYLDNAATTWPKPPEVGRAMLSFIEEIGANPGRSAHRLSVAAGRIVAETREALADLCGAPDPLRVIFCADATEALNLALRGLLRAGDHVITSSVEHNSVMRPLRKLESDGVMLSVVACAPDGTLDPAAIAAARRPETVLIALTHASNVVGTLLPIAEVGRFTREHDLLLLVDAAASAGATPIHFERDLIDLLAFTGHKNLYGPTGTGGLIVGERVAPNRMKPLKFGGTGSSSEKEEQPAFLPDAYESGTLNAVGLAGLLAGVRWVQEQGIGHLEAARQALVQQLIDGLQAIPGVTVHGTRDARRQCAPVAFTVANRSPAEIGLRLDEEFGILCRVGLHCAPAAHRTLGTFPTGTLRFAVGAFTTASEVDRALAAVASLAASTPG